MEYDWLRQEVVNINTSTNEAGRVLLVKTAFILGVNISLLVELVNQYNIFELINIFRVNNLLSHICDIIKETMPNKPFA